MLSWAPAAVSQTCAQVLGTGKKTGEQKVYSMCLCIRGFLLRSAEYFINFLFNSRGYIERQRCKVSQMIGPFSICNPSVRHKLERGVGSRSHTAASDLHKETPVITNRCHITFSIMVIKWVEIPRDSVIEVHARGCIAQLPAVSGEGKLCTGNELWLAEFSLIIASKSIMCAPC